MRAFFRATALAALLLAAAAPASRAAHDSVSGTATHQGADPPFPLIQVRINARAGADGSDPRGKLVSDAKNATTEGKYTARVTCLSIYGAFGDAATVGVEIVKAKNPAFVG